MGGNATKYVWAFHMKMGTRRREMPGTSKNCSEMWSFSAASYMSDRNRCAGSQP